MNIIESNFSSKAASFEFSMLLTNGEMAPLDVLESLV